jgi:DNA-binding CsgD family transcriptional regulator
MTEPIDNKLVVNKWPSLSDINSPHNIFKEYYTRGFANGIDICRVNNEILEAWTFIGTVNDTKLMNMHLQNCHILKQFISFFDTKFQAIIGNQSHIPFANFKNGAIIRPENDINIVNDTNKFLRYLEQCNREICIRNNIIRFTKREFESLEHLAKGESVKEIAKNLNLSPRTIEEYINKIKYKTGYILKSDLIKLFQDKFY